MSLYKTNSRAEWISGGQEGEAEGERETETETERERERERSEVGGAWAVFFGVCLPSIPDLSLSCGG